MKLHCAAAAAVAALTSSATAYTFEDLRPRQGNTANVLPPSQDPWYTAPAGYESALPGTILRVRPAAGNLTSVVANSSAAYNILYRTTNSRYQPTFAVTTLFVPPNNFFNPKDKLLSYQIPYDSADVDSSPSYSLYQGANSDITTALGKGWFVSVPDYEGPLASFTAGVMSGHATLDSVRASLASDLGLVNGSHYAMFGYSGGALASEWAAELQVQYAPELNFSGAALGGLTPNVTSVLLAVNGQPDTGLIPSGILGLATQYPELLALLKSNLNPSGPYNASTFLAAYNQTLIESIVAFLGQNISDYFQSGFTLLSDPVSQRVINSDGIMGYHGVPQMPLFVYKAIKDEVSPIADTDVLVQRYCGVGATIKYDRNSVGGHGQEYVNGDARATEFLDQVLNGMYTMTGCQISNVTVGTE